MAVVVRIVAPQDLAAQGSAGYLELQTGRTEVADLESALAHTVRIAALGGFAQARTALQSRYRW